MKKLKDDFKAQFKDLLNTEIPEWIIFPFLVELENANSVTFLKEELIEMTFNLKAKSMYTCKGIGYYWMIEKL